MAARYALVPESWLNNRTNNSPIDNASSANRTTSESHVSIANDSTDNDYFDVNDLSEMLPKNYRSKAKLLLSLLKNKISLDQNQRVVYGDGFVGSHILDILRYFLSPFRTERPVDSKMFENLIKNSSVPDSVMSNYRRRQSNNWKPYN